MMKKIIMVILLCLPIAVSAQKVADISKYLAGAVPTENGYVTFKQDFKVDGVNKEKTFLALMDYAQKQLVEGPDHLEKARITEADTLNGLVVVSMEEYLYFKRKAWTSDRVRFNYQLIFQVVDGGFSAEMRRLTYRYDDVPNAELRRAEDWIVDAVALTADGKALKKKPGKHRRCIIDRKDAIFGGALEWVKK
jgi:colicin import membrane protein